MSCQPVPPPFLHHKSKILVPVCSSRCLASNGSLKLDSIKFTTLMGMRTRAHRWNPGDGQQGCGVWARRLGVTVRHDESCWTRGAKTSSTWKVMVLRPVCPEFMAKANPTAAGKLVFVIWISNMQENQSLLKHLIVGWSPFGTAIMAGNWCCETETVHCQTVGTGLNLLDEFWWPNGQEESRKMFGCGRCLKCLKSLWDASNFAENQTFGTQLFLSVLLALSSRLVQPCSTLKCELNMLNNKKLDIQSTATDKLKSHYDPFLRLDLGPKNHPTEPRHSEIRAVELQLEGTSLTQIWSKRYIPWSWIMFYQVSSMYLNNFLLKFNVFRFINIL